MTEHEGTPLVADQDEEELREVQAELARAEADLHDARERAGQQR